MKRRLYVVECLYSGGAWYPQCGEAILRLAKKTAKGYARHVDTRVVAYGPSGERVSARPLLVLKAKKAPDS